MTIDDFAEDFRQRVLVAADAEGEFREDAFFDIACEYLVESGDLDTADRVPYRHPSRGIRVDGYAGDPHDAAGTLSLIGLDYSPAPSVGRLVGSQMDAIFQRMKRFVTQSLSEAWRNALEETSPAFGLADLIAFRWPSINKVRLVLVSNRQLSDRVDGRPAGVLEGKRVTYSVWDLRRLHRADTSSEPEEMVIDLANDFGGPIAILPAQHISDVHESYLAVIPGTVLAEIYDTWGPRLLEQNVRVFLQARSKVNRGIRDTLVREPKMFFAYNNGVTATAQAVDMLNDGGSLMLQRMTNFQIVNGGQTTASIHSAMRKDQDLSQTYVQMKLSVVDPQRATEVVPRISEYANSQNRVAASDFFANHPFHRRVENFSRRLYAPSAEGTFQQSKWFYERARGQFADARAGKTRAQRKRFDLEYPRRQKFTKTDLAKFLSVWDGLPHIVSLGAQKNFASFAQRIGAAWKKRKNDYNEEWYREAIAKAIVFRSTERIVSAQPWYQGGFRANIVAYTIARVSHQVGTRKRSMDFQAIWRRQEPGPALKRVIAVVSKNVHDVLVDPPEGMRNVTEWAKKELCWKRVMELEFSWPVGLDDELVSAEEKQASKRSARREQIMLNGIEAQIAVFNAGPEFWKEALAWGERESLLSPTDIGVLKTAAKGGPRPLSERQAVRAVQALTRLQKEGYGEKLPTPESFD